MKEIWKDILNYEGLYEISNLGKIRNIKSKRVLKLTKSHNGYLKTNLSKKGKLKTVFIHRLVAEAFIPNPNNLPQVNHKDGNKENNNVFNLEFCTEKHNSLHAVRAGLIKVKKVVSYDIIDKNTKNYESVKKAAEEINCNYKKIYNAIHNETILNNKKWSYK